MTSALYTYDLGALYEMAGAQNGAQSLPTCRTSAKCHTHSFSSTYIHELELMSLRNILLPTFFGYAVQVGRLCGRNFDFCSERGDRSDL